MRWDSFEDILHILKMETIAYEPFSWITALW